MGSPALRPEASTRGARYPELKEGARGGTMGSPA